MNIEIIKPNYPKSITKHNERQRKKLNICQYGDAMIDFVFSSEYKTTLEKWWSEKYKSLGEEFNCELYDDGDKIHVMFLEGTPFYKTTKKAKKQIPCVQDGVEGFVNYFLETLPAGFDICAEKVIVTDWDFAEHLGEEYNETVRKF